MHKRVALLDHLISFNGHQHQRHPVCFLPPPSASASRVVVACCLDVRVFWGCVNTEKKKEKKSTLQCKNRIEPFCAHQFDHKREFTFVLRSITQKPPVCFYSLAASSSSSFLSAFLPSSLLCSLFRHRSCAPLSGCRVLWNVGSFLFCRSIPASSAQLHTTVKVPPHKRSSPSSPCLCLRTKSHSSVFFVLFAFLLRPRRSFGVGWLVFVSGVVLRQFGLHTKYMHTEVHTEKESSNRSPT